ncbi:T9SS type A sorting domain-containing protein [bacterium]|nr:T9SS type A sorting domain-containing protein [bacterium]MBU1065788.1 T9SS type A sorting domain-containing protein [bacterium]MBU1635433.1 T9SS type A sorting domain-containing protein [bacterium]MBU1873664.1 T9SS type A sorting domain-containing protein [bacterium]
MIDVFYKKVILIWARNVKNHPGSIAAILIVIFSSFLAAQAPQEWNVNYNDYEFFMTVTGIAVINGVESTNPENVIAAFVNDECRGVDTTTETQGSQLFFLMVRNNINSEIVTFKLYNAEIDSVLDCTNSIVFSVSEGIGTVDEPYDFIANYYVNSIIGTIPEKFELLTNYPNPFNSSTSIRFSISENADVQLSIFNMNGERIIVLANERKSAGDYIVPWNGKDNSGNNCATGEYIIQMMNDNEQYLRKVMLIK